MQQLQLTKADVSEEIYTKAVLETIAINVIGKRTGVAGLDSAEKEQAFKSAIELFEYQSELSDEKLNALARVYNPVDFSGAKGDLEAYAAKVSGNNARIRSPFRTKRSSDIASTIAPYMGIAQLATTLIVYPYCALAGEEKIGNPIFYTFGAVALAGVVASCAAMYRLSEEMDIQGCWDATKHVLKSTFTYGLLSGRTCAERYRDKVKETKNIVSTNLPAALQRVQDAEDRRPRRALPADNFAVQMPDPSAPPAPLQPGVRR